MTHTRGPRPARLAGLGLRARPASLAGALILMLATMGAALAATLQVDSFDDRSVASPWYSWNTTAAGTSSSVALSGGYASPGALRLNYGFQCLTARSNCGQLALAIRGYPQALAAKAAMRFVTRSPLAAKLDLRIIDTSGQTLQYEVTRAAQGYDPAVWYPAVIDLARPAAHWGGAASGSISGGISSIRFVVSTRSGQAESGSVDIDRIELLDVLPAAGAGGFAGGRLTIDDFEDRPVVAPWTAWHTDGAGTRATLASQAGFASSRAMRVDYGFDCRVAASNCGQFALAVLGVASPFPVAPALSFRTRSPAAAEVVLRLIDSSGQTLQYATSRPPEGFDPTQWYEAVVDLAKPQASWGGAASGRIEQGIRSVRFLVMTRSGQAEAGAVELDDVTLLEQLPAPVGKRAVNGVLVVDDFEDRPVVAPWSVWATSGAGTSAALAAQAGAGSVRGMRFDYGFACAVSGSSCGQLAMATLNLTEPLAPLAGLAFMTRSPSSANLSLRIVDASGQTLQYTVRRPPEGYDPTAWYRAVVDLAAPVAFWGGAASGRIDQSIRSIRLLVETRSGQAERGAIELDDVALLEALPPATTRTAVNGVLTVDDFEDRAVVAPWSAWVSGQSGTAAALAPQAGAGSARGLRFDYAFDCRVSNSSCGQLAMATLNLADPLQPLAGLRFNTRSPAVASLSVRVVDGSGQTLQYPLVRPPVGYDPSAWYPAVVDLAAPQAFWGGAGSGRISDGIRSIRILVETRSGQAEQGAVQIDDLALLQVLPAPVLPVARDGVMMLDDFEDRSVVQPWAAWATGGAGTSGAVAPQAGHASARGMRIDYAFACLQAGSDCGEFAQATLSLPVAVDFGAALSFMTRAPVSARLGVRLLDGSGQTLQYRVIRPLAAYDPAVWFRASVDLAHPIAHWGGAASGVVTGGIRKLMLTVSSTAGVAVSGAVQVDDVALLQTLPADLIALDQGQATVDSFNARSVLGPWAFVAGDARSSGTLSSVDDGQGGRMLAMDFAFGCDAGGCGSYALAELALPTPVEAGEAMALRVRSPGNVTLALRVVDATGETLQYPVGRSLEGAREDRWYAVRALLGSPEISWGGNADGVVDSPIRGVAVVARNAFGDEAAGRVELDDIVVLADADTGYVLSHASPAIAPDPEDMPMAARFGAAHHPGASSAPVDAAAAAGLSALRIDLFWARIERPGGQLDFSEYDAIIDGMLSRGLDVLLILDYGHPDHDVRSAEGIAAFSRYAAAAAQRYAGAHVTFEIWNEPNHPTYWGGAADAGQYAALARGALAAIRAAAPEAVVSTGGLSYFDFPYLKEMLRLGAASGADAVALHAYEKPEALAEKWVQADRMIRDTTGATLPIWLTEWGYSVGTVDAGSTAASPGFLERQGILTARGMLSHWALGADVSIAYKLANAGDDPASVEDNFGLFDRSLAEKPAATAARTLIGMAGGKLNLGLLADTPPGLHVMVLADEAEVVYAVWQSEAAHPSRVELPIAGLVGMADALGREWMPAMTTGAGGMVSVELDEATGPVYLRYAR